MEINNMIYKKGDRVKLVGHCDWNRNIMKDVGLIGVVVSVNTSYTHIELSKSISGNTAWNVYGNKGIEFAFQPGQQLEFSFMTED